MISSQQGVKYVFVVKPDNTVERRNLETGHDFRRQTHREERAEGRRESCLDAAAIGAAGHAGDSPCRSSRPSPGREDQRRAIRKAEDERELRCEARTP